MMNRLAKRLETCRDELIQIKRESDNANPGFANNRVIFDTYFIEIKELIDICLNQINVYVTIKNDNQYAQISLVIDYDIFELIYMLKPGENPKNTISGLKRVVNIGNSHVQLGYYNEYRADNCFPTVYESHITFLQDLDVSPTETNSAIYLTSKISADKIKQLKELVFHAKDTGNFKVRVGSRCVENKAVNVTKKFI